MWLSSRTCHEFDVSHTKIPKIMTKCPTLIILFGKPDPPHLSVLFIGEMLMGLFLALGVTAFLDKLGTAMFHRGFAKPFYIKGHRIHHSVLYCVVPISYGLISVLFFMGYLKFIWHDMWMNIGLLTMLVAVCVAIDFIGDRFWPEIRKNVILHHEWVYSVIPVFIVAYMFNVII